MSHAQRIKEQDAATRGRMLHFLGDENWLTTLVSDTGNDWLEKHFDATRARQCAAYSQAFWAWWKNQWAITDSRLSPLLKVDKAGVMHYSRDAHHTTFIHDQAEFRCFYQVHHLLQIGKLVVPAELAAHWVATARTLN